MRCHKILVVTKLDSYGYVIPYVSFSLILFVCLLPKHISGTGIKMETEANRAWPLERSNPLENSDQKFGNAATATVMGNTLNILEY